MADLAQRLLAQKQAFAIAPAGCGKTQTIAQMVSIDNSGCHLILTHTHAGVQSIAKRLRQLGVPANRYRLETISSFSLRFALNYPNTTGWTKSFPDQNDDWSLIYRGVTHLLTLPFMRRVISASYCGLVVDEYQDCTQDQHFLVMALADIIPSRILGDPLQGIFGFSSRDKPLNWDLDVRSNFVEVNVTPIPYRWLGKNEKLGQWLIGVRNDLMQNKPIPLDQPNCPVKWKPYSREVINNTLLSFSKSSGTVVAISPEGKKKRNDCHLLAQHLRGRFQSIEEMDAAVLLAWADKFDKRHGAGKALWCIEFTSQCWTSVSTELKTIRDRFTESESPDFSRIKKYVRIVPALLGVAGKEESPDVAAVLGLLVQEVEDCYLYRADLWTAMLWAFRYYRSGKYESLREAAWLARQRQKYIGRTEYKRIVSTTLLIKGLEYDHGVLLNAHGFDSKNLYVALTRASVSLTVISDSPLLNG